MRFAFFDKRRHAFLEIVGDGAFGKIRDLIVKLLVYRRDERLIDEFFGACKRLRCTV